MRQFITFMITLALVCGCAATRYVEVPVDRVHIEYRGRMFIDTLLIRDSVVVKEKSDTVFLEKYKYIYKVRELHDTTNVTDTVTVTKPVEVVREVNRVYNWQIILMILGGAALAFGIYRIVVFFKGKFNIKI